MSDKKKPKVEDEEDSEEDKDKKEAKKKRKKSKVEDEAEESDEGKAAKKKKKLKSKVDKTESEDETKDVEKKPKKESRVSNIESVSTAVSTADPEKADIDIIDPMKDKNRMKTLKKCISHLCLLVMVLGLKNVLLGFCAHMFYDNKTHLVLFGAICILQLIGAPVGWMAIRMGNRMLFLVCVIINLIWLISVIILLLYYWLINKSSSFNNEIALHVGAVFFMSASIILAICCFLMMQRLDMINITYKKPEVVISPEGKASEKAKLKQKS